MTGASSSLRRAFASAHAFSASCRLSTASVMLPSASARSCSSFELSCVSSAMAFSSAFFAAAMRSSSFCFFCSRALMLRCADASSSFAICGEIMNVGGGARVAGNAGA